MNLRAVAGIAAALAGLATTCERLSTHYDVEIHVSKVWAEDEALPKRLRR